LELSEIKSRVRDREEDYVMPIYLPFLPMILSIGTIFAVVVFILGSLAMGFIPGMGFGAGLAILTVSLALFSAVLWIYVLYKWIDRRNKHFKRVSLLYEDILDFLEEEGVEDKVKRARRTLRDFKGDIDEKSAVLWVVLTIVFNPVILYIYHFLTRDYYNHETNENKVIEDIEEAIKESGGDFEFEGYDTVEDRNTVLYIVLTIITLGIFGLYWIYTLTNDPNQHFNKSKSVEKDLIDSLKTI